MAEGRGGETLRRLGRLARKELSEILRDRRTIVTLVLMPVLLYPLLSIAFQQFFLASTLDVARAAEHRIGLDDAEQFRFFRKLLAQAEKLYDRSDARLPTAGSGQEKTPARKTEVMLVDDVHVALAGRHIDVGVRLAEPEVGADGRRLEPLALCELTYLSDSSAGQGAAVYVERRLAALNERQLSNMIEAWDDWRRRFVAWLGKQPQAQPPPAEPRMAGAALAVRRIAVATEGQDGLINLAALVPLILILMTITGAVYPAIDLTAGERERGTLEILVAAPVPRLELLFAKYVAVVCVAVLTAVVNLTAMIATLSLSGLGRIVLNDNAFTPGLLAELFALLLLFALFFSAVLLSVTSFARSFKEGQAYLIPIMLASLGPGLIGILPGLKLGDYAAVPLVNIVLMGRDLLQNELQAAPAFLAITATLAYAGAGIALAARVFGSEAVLYSEQSGWADLVRRPRGRSAQASLPTVFWSLALLIPAHFGLHGLTRASQPTLEGQLALVAAGSVLLFAGVPLLAAWWARIDAARGFRLTPPSLGAFAGACVLGAAVGPLVLQLLSWWLGENAERFEELLRPVQAAWQAAPLAMTLAVVLPALAEELFFRGWLFAALARWCGPMPTIAVSAGLFGLMHVIMGSPLGMVRLLPSTLLGVLLGWVAWRSGSVFPCLALHGLHNGFLQVYSRMWGPAEAVPAEWLAGAAAACLVGGALVGLGSGRGSGVGRPPDG